MSRPTIYDEAVRLGPPPPVYLTPSGVAITRGRLNLTPAQLATIEPYHLDGFAGGGGASEGYYLATGRHADLACNHDREALAMHRGNHPFTKHFLEDIRKMPWRVVIKRLLTSAHFSPDCKDFSKAKGGKPKSKRIRGLAWVIVHLINELGPLAPLVITLENVEEFLDWCPLDLHGNRKKKLRGWFFQCFVGALRRRGYDVEWREMRACDYSRTPTIRKRLYLVARRDGQPIRFPELRTEAPGRAADVLDLTLPCPSIFMTREQGKRFSRETGIKVKRPIVKASCKRIAKGVKRYVMDAAEPFLVCLTHHGIDGAESIRAPFKTVTGAQRGERSLVAPSLAKICTGSVGSDVREPFPTVVAASHHKRPGGNPPLAVVSAFLAKHNFGDKPHYGADEPVRTVVAGGGHESLVSVFLAQNNGGMVGHDAREPVSTIAGKGSNQSLVAVGFAKYYGTEQDPRLGEPLHSVTTKDRFGLFAAQLEVPVLTPELAEKARRVARWLRRHGVKVAGEFAMCGEFVIVDIGMRMLTPRELYRAQGFQDDYIIDRGWLEDGTEIVLTKTAQVRMVGNSVCPPMAEAIFRCNLPPEHLAERLAA